MCLDDLKNVLFIQAECYIEVEPESLASLQSRLEISPDTCWVVCEDKQVVAYLICHPWVEDNIPALDTKLKSIPQGAQVFYIHDLAVGIAHRGKGIGQTLVKETLSYAQNKKYKKAKLIAVQKSLKFWQSFGFQKLNSLSLENKLTLKTYGLGSIAMENDFERKP